MRLETTEWDINKIDSYIADHIVKYYGFSDDTIEVSQAQYDDIKYFFERNGFCIKDVVMGRPLVVRLGN